MPVPSDASTQDTAWGDTQPSESAVDVTSDEPLARDVIDVMDGTTVGDAAVPRIYDPVCAARRPDLVSTPAGGADRCEGVSAPAEGTGSTWCSRGADVPGLRAPAGFCVRRFAQVGLPRVMARAPNGDLFVSSPSQGTGAGDTGGRGEILALSDDNRDGTAEIHVFSVGLPDVHAIAFSADRQWLYFSTHGTVQRTRYTMGMRAEQTASREFIIGGPVTLPGGATGTDPLSMTLTMGRWTHGLAVSANDRLYVTNGEYSACQFSPTGQVMHGSGSIYEAGSHTLTRVSTGFRNPMYARCHPCKELCLAAELGEDNRTGATEKLVAIESQRWFGYPCCDQRGTGAQQSSGLCNCVDQELSAITLGDTPFGFDWEPGAWPAPYRNGIFVAQHGSFYAGDRYPGAGVVFLATDPDSGRPVGRPMRFLEATNELPQPMRTLTRPSDVVFSRDGRMFVADDRGQSIYWLAPLTWRGP